MTSHGESRPTHSHADKDGHFRRKDSSFRSSISREAGAKYPPEKGRYAMYMNYGCPWAHRASAVRSLKGLEDIIQMIPTDFDLTANGWTFTGKNGSEPKDPLYGFSGLKQLYMMVDPQYEGRYTVPCLFDKKTETIVNNESSEIIRMFYTEFDDLIPEEQREVTKGAKGLYPEHLRKEIDEMNDWVYNTVNNGVYKCGFATTQAAYDANIYPLFESLDRLESHLTSRGGPFLFGEYLTEADIRLYTTLIRFDTAYDTIFQTNLKSIRHDYPALHLWLRRIYWDESALTSGGAFKKTTNFEAYKEGYARARGRLLKKGKEEEAGADEIVMPRGLAVDIAPLTEEEKLKA